MELVNTFSMGQCFCDSRFTVCALVPFSEVSATGCSQCWGGFTWIWWEYSLLPGTQGGGQIEGFLSRFLGLDPALKDPSSLENCPVISKSC